jgi:hypothetical protein
VVVVDAGEFGDVVGAGSGVETLVVDGVRVSPPPEPPPPPHAARARMKREQPMR